jgi:acetylornithine/succinyldiaminopimelate/putrescine aminotransferase
MEVSRWVPYIYDTNNKILGFCGRSIGLHVGHQPQSKPSDQRSIGYSHVMVYGEYSQSPAVEYCKNGFLIARTIKKTCLVNSGTEAIEGALKLARRNRSQPINFCHNAYHGNTMGSMSVMGFEERKQIFWPLIRMSILSPSITKLI